MFKVNQKVWCAIYGEGIVKRIRQESGIKHPVIVLVNSNTDDENVVTYTADGKYHEGVNVTLFPYPVEIVKAVTKPSIEWSHVSECFRYLAMDADGRCWLWVTKPAPFQEQWCGDSLAVKAENFASSIPGTCDWRDSLVERPN